MVSTSVLEDGVILVQARAEVDEGLEGAPGISEAEWTVAPGGELFGVPYVVWAEHAPGGVDVPKLRAGLTS